MSMHMKMHVLFWSDFGDLFVIAHRNTSVVSTVDVELSKSNCFLKTWYVVIRIGVTRALFKEISTESEHANSRFGLNIKHDLLGEQTRKLTDKISLLQGFESYIIAKLIIYAQLNFTIDKKVHLLTHLSSLQNKGTFMINLNLHSKRDTFIKSIFKTFFFFFTWSCPQNDIWLEKVNTF